MAVIKSFLTFILVGGISSCAFAEGLSEERQKDLLDSLQNYKPLEDKSFSSDSKLLNLERSCKLEEVAVSQYCLEKKYMAGERYVVKVTFRKSVKTPDQPRVTYVRDANGVVIHEDTSSVDAFYEKWSDTILREYVGDDYNKFNDVKLQTVYGRVVIVELQVFEANEIKELIADPRIILVRHIAEPETSVEEVEI